MKLGTATSKNVLASFFSFSFTLDLYTGTTNTQSWAHRSLKSLNRSSLLSEP